MSLSNLDSLCSSSDVSFSSAWALGLVWSGSGLLSSLTPQKSTPTRFLNQNTLLTKYPTGPTQTYSQKKKNPTFFLVTGPSYSCFFFFFSSSSSGFQTNLLLLVGLGPFFFSSSLFYFFFWWVSVLLPICLSLFICVLYR